MKSLVLLISCLLFLSASAENLILVGASYGKNIIAICDEKGEVLWSFKTGGPQRGHTGHHDIQLLPNGNILFHDSWTKTSEITLGKQIVWTYDSANMNGNKGRVDVHAFKRLPNGNTVIVESGVGRIIEVDKEGKLVHSFPLRKGGPSSTRLMRMTEKGTYLVCAENPGIVIEYDRDGKVIWEYLVKSRIYGAIRLKNGNTLIATGNGKSVIEVTPDKKIVWEIKGKVPETDIGLGWMTCLQELPDGKYVIGNCHAGDKNPQVFTIDPKTKKVTWQFDEWELVGNGLACWEVLTEEQSAMIRSKLASMKK